MKNTEEAEIRLSDIAAALLKAFRPILFVALAFLLLGAAFGFVKAGKAAAVTEEDVRLAEKDYLAAKDAFSEAELALSRKKDWDVPAAEAAIVRSEQIALHRREYVDNSLFYALDPFHCGISRLSFYVETDSKIDPSAPWLGVDPQASIVTAYTRIFSSDGEILDRIRELMGCDASAAYLKEVVSVYGVSDRFVEIVVRHADAQVAEKVADYLYETLLERLNGSVGGFSANTISRFTGYEVDWEINDHHLAAEDNLMTAERNLQEAKDKLQQLKDDISTQELELAEVKEKVERAQKAFESKKAALASSFGEGKGVVKKTLRYALIMFAGGLLLGCFSALFLFLAGGKLENQSGILSRYDFPLLGVLPKKERRMFDKTIRRLEGDPETDYDSAARVALQNFRSLAVGKRFCVVSSLGKETAEKLAAFFEGGDVPCGDILRDSSAVKALADVDGILLVEERGRSRIGLIDSEVLQASSLGKEIFGIILL